MIQETIATFSTNRIYQENINEINPESLNFILENGAEKMVVRNKELNFVPGNGKNGQILKNGDGYIYWDDLNSIKTHLAVNNIGVQYSKYIIQTGSNAKDSKSEIKFLGDFVKGQTIELYITKDDSTYPITAVLNTDKFTLLTKQTEFLISEGTYTYMRFISDGEKVYVEARLLTDSSGVSWPSGTTGQVLTKTSSGVEFQTKEFVPSGGSSGQVLTKTNSGTEWGVSFWVGTQDDFDKISTKDSNTFYFIKE